MRSICAVMTMLFFNMPTLVHATEQGLFWQLVSPSGNTSYLFGTVHTDDNRVTDFSPAVLDALKQVDLFVMETQPNGNPANYMMAEGHSLATMLTEAELDKVRALTDFHVMHLSQVLRMKPWLLAVLFSQSKPQTPYAQDNLLMRGAEDFGKLVEGLESSRAHFGVIDDFSMEDQLTMLRIALKRTDTQKEKDFEALISAYLKEDSDVLLALDEDIAGAGLPTDLWQRIRYKLLDERNTMMAKRAIALAQNQSVFIAVGAAHLAGKNGFINAFKAAGYQLSALKK